MKYCPVCDERYDEDIIRFCTKDGTPLIDEEEPKFTAIPSELPEEPDDPFGEETVIRRNPVNRPDPIETEPERESERFVIPTTPEPDQYVRQRASTAYYPTPPPPNTGKTIVLTILGTLAVLGFGAGMFWLLQRDDATNININTNPPNLNANLNTNLGFDANFNFNTNANFDSNFNMPDFNINTNIRTPSPTPSPRTSPSPIPSLSPSPTPERTPAVSPTTRPPANIPPTSPTPRTGPRPPIMTSNRTPAGNN
jgi:hypothetical protein